MDFIDKKEKLAILIEEYMNNTEKEAELIRYINELSNDFDFNNKELFKNIFDEISKYLPGLSHKELKQRVLMIRAYID